MPSVTILYKDYKIIGVSDSNIFIPKHRYAYKPHAEKWTFGGCETSLPNFNVNEYYDNGKIVKREIAITNVSTASDLHNFREISFPIFARMMQLFSLAEYTNGILSSKDNFEGRVCFQKLRLEPIENSS